MACKVLLSRVLPFPPFSVDDQPIETCVYKPSEKGHKNAQVYCSTALDKVDAALIMDLSRFS